MEKNPVAVLGATGTVGQKIIRLLDAHPQFSVSEVVASVGHQGLRYDEACRWKEETALSPEIAALTLQTAEKIKSPWVISALPPHAAQQIEPILAERGHHIFTNASAHRMEANVPLLIPEINLSHLQLIEKQPTKGKIVANPNCMATIIALALAPLHAQGDLERVSSTTMQAISGAGYPGVSSFDSMGNIIPFIEGEEEKIETETLKILGQIETPADFELITFANRVPVLHGHMATLHCRFQKPVEIEEILKLFNEKKDLYLVYEDPYSPQPARHLSSTDMRIHIGRMKLSSDKRTLSFTALGHNLVRGAAGAAILNLESTWKYLCKSQSSEQEKQEAKSSNPSLQKN